MNGTSRPEAARTQRTQKDTPAPDDGMIEVGAGTVAQVTAVLGPPPDTVPAVDGWFRRFPR